MIEIERNSYTVSSWALLMDKFVNNENSWFNVLDQSVVNWFASRVEFGGDILSSMLLTARDDPYPDKYLNVGIVDCTFSPGQLIEGDYSSLFDKRHLIYKLFPTTERKLSEKADWSLREYLAVFKSGNSTAGIAAHKKYYDRTTDDIKKKIYNIGQAIDHSGWATARVKAATEIPDSLLFAPFTQRREVSLLVEELNLINSRVTIPFDDIIHNLPLGGVVDVIPTMIRLGATKGHIDCMGLPWITHPLVVGTCCAGGAKYMDKPYSARELLILQEITKQSIDVEDQAGLFEAVVLTNAPDDFDRKARVAIKKINKPLQEQKWTMGPRYRKPLFIGDNPAYEELAQVGKVRSTIKSSDPDATTYESVLSPTSPAESSASSFSDVSKPMPRKSSDPTPLGSLRAGAKPIKSVASVESVASSVAKLEAGLSVLAEAQATQAKANAAFQATVMKLLENK